MKDMHLKQNCLSSVKKMWMILIPESSYLANFWLSWPQKTTSQSHYCPIYSGTPFNGHPSTADTYDKTDSSESPEHISICFNTINPPE